MPTLRISPIIYRIDIFTGKKLRVLGGSEDRELTLRLLLIGCDGADEVLGCHVNLSIPVLINDLQCGKVAENLVRGRVCPDPVLILHDLPTGTRAKMFYVS